MIKAAVLERGRRSTAGTRSSAPEEKELEEDEYFWSRSKWSEDLKGDMDLSDASESFRESEEEESDKIDIFDSDFNDTENEEEYVERENGEHIFNDESMVYKERNSNKKMLMKNITSRRASLKKKKKSASNSGLSFLFQSHEKSGKKCSVVSRQSGRKKYVGVYTDKLLEETTTSMPTIEHNKIHGLLPSKFAKDPNDARRSLRTKTIANSVRSILSSSTGLPETSNNNGSSKNLRKKRKFTQEELLLEAAQVTEAENERWLLSRKRFQNKSKLSSETANLNQKICRSIENIKERKTVVRYRSCRLYNTLTFLDTDYFPEIFVNKFFTMSHNCEDARTEYSDEMCVITGKVARYKDPKSGRGYHNLTAFRELRNILSIGEPFNKLLSLKMRSGGR